MGEAGEKPISKRRSTADSGNVTLVAKPGSYAVTGTDAEAAIIGRDVIQAVAPADARQARIESSLEEIKRLMQAPKRPPKSRRRKHKRRQARPVRKEIFAKLRKKFPPDGKAAKKLSPTDACREIGIDPRRYWHSMKRALG